VPRAGALPAELAGLDPLSDAFPHAQPTGAELVALTRLRAIAYETVTGIPGVGGVMVRKTGAAVWTR